MLKQIQFYKLSVWKNTFFYEALKHGNAGNEQFITTNVISKGLIAVFIKGCFRILVKKYRYIDIIRT